MLAGNTIHAVNHNNYYKILGDYAVQTENTNNNLKTHSLRNVMKMHQGRALTMTYKDT